MYTHVGPRRSDSGISFIYFALTAGTWNAFCTITLLMCMNMQTVNVTGTFVVTWYENVYRNVNERSI